MLEVRNAKEALYIACEMERRAIDLYSRALTLYKEAHVISLIESLMGDEKEHLKNFVQMGETVPQYRIDEKSLLLSAYAAEVLFPGGLMEAERKGAFTSLPSLLEYAIDGEKKAIMSYKVFSNYCEQKEAKTMFLAIAAEEEEHLRELEAQLGGLE